MISFLALFRAMMLLLSEPLCLLLLAGLQVLVREESKGTADEDQRIDADTKACGICALGLGGCALLCALGWRVVLLQMPGKSVLLSKPLASSRLAPVPGVGRHVHRA